MTKISIIIPAYNSELFIGEAIASVLSQSEKALEIIVVNDGSTDGTLAIAEGFAARDSRVRIISQANSGKPSIARNAGIRHASGEFICFLDADDLFLPGKLEKQLSVFRDHPQVNLVFHDVKDLLPSGIPAQASYLGRIDHTVAAAGYLTPVGENVYLCKQNYYNFMSAYCTSVSTQTTMIRRSCLDQQPVWFDEEMTIGEDIDLWFRLANANRLAYLDEVLSYYRHHDGSITRNLQAYFKGSLEAHRQNLNRGEHLLNRVERDMYRKKISGQHFHYGYYLYLQSEPESARRQYLESIRIRPNVRAFRALCKTFIPATVANWYKSSRDRRPENG